MPNIISKDSPIPLYAQLAEEIRTLILKENLDPGDYIPTEDWFSKTYSVSRVTVRKAIDQLLKEGTLARERSKSPVVAGHRVTRPSNQLTGLSQDLIAGGHTSDSQFLVREVAIPPFRVSKFFGMDVDTPVCYICRIRYSDGQPIGLENTYYPTEFEGIPLSPVFEGESFYSYLERQGVVLDTAEQIVSCCNAAVSEANALNVHQGTALLKVERMVYANGGPIDYSIVYYHPARYDIRMELYR